MYIADNDEPPSILIQIEVICREGMQPRVL